MPLVIVDIPVNPFDKIYMDIVGPLPITGQGNKYILSMVDELTKFVEFVALPDQTADTVARGLYENILCRYTIPRSIVTDNGTNFVGEVFKRLCKMFNIQNLRTTAYHPQANAMERQHSTLGNYLRMYTGDRPNAWDGFLRSAAHAYNNSIHRGTGYPPMQLLFGFCAEMPSRLTKAPEPLYTYDDYIQELRYKLQKGVSEARKNLMQANGVAKYYHDIHVNVKEFKKGEKVYLRNPTRNTKLAPIWQGPYEILEINGPVNVTLKLENRVTRVHKNRLKQCWEGKWDVRGEP